MKTGYVESLINQGENLCLDFKFEVNDSAKIARSLSAFANTKGGKLLIGVKDNGKIKGINSEEEYHMIEAASQMHTYPEVKFSSIKHNIQGKIVLEIDVPEGENKPYKAPDSDKVMKAFIRIHDENKVACGTQVKVWKKQKQSKGIKISYNDAEKFLLNYMNENKTITLNEFRKKAKISYNKAQTIVVNFVVLNLIKLKREEAKVYFILNENV